MKLNAFDAPKTRFMILTAAIVWVVVCIFFFDKVRLGNVFRVIVSFDDAITMTPTYLFSGFSLTSSRHDHSHTTVIDSKARALAIVSHVNPHRDDGCLAF
eukprot:m.363557 g.363557  ORF g.363557 m.363557 type:complete len:100 (-) comp23038_c0_seq1:597-896(-)